MRVKGIECDCGRKEHASLSCGVPISTDLNRAEDAEAVVERQKKRIEELEAEIARRSNPWTIEIRHREGWWTDWCHDAPITIQEAEQREKDLKTENPDATFRVAPWFNSAQRQYLNEREKKLREALNDVAEAILAGNRPNVIDMVGVLTET